MIRKPNIRKQVQELHDILRNGVKYSRRENYTARQIRNVRRRAVRMYKALRP